MKRKRGQRKRTGKVDPIAIAMLVELKSRHGLKLAKAVDFACDFFARERDTVLAALRITEVEPGFTDEELRDYIREHKRPE